MQNFSRDYDYELCILLAQTRDAVYKARKKELTAYNLSPRKSATLFAIDALGGETTPADIARYLFRENHSISGILNRMGQEGLVRKVKDTNRKHRVKVALTEKGRQAYAQSLKRESIQEITSYLTVAERQELWSSLVKIRNKALEYITLREAPFPLIKKGRAIKSSGRKKRLKGNGV